MLCPPARAKRLVLQFVPQRGITTTKRRGIRPRGKGRVYLKKKKSVFCIYRLLIYTAIGSDRGYKILLLFIRVAVIGRNGHQQNQQRVPAANRRRRSVGARDPVVVRTDKERGITAACVVRTVVGGGGGRRCRKTGRARAASPGRRWAWRRSLRRAMPARRTRPRRRLRHRSLLYIHFFYICKNRIPLHDEYRG